jgi:predicted transcriptional regulator
MAQTKTAISIDKSLFEAMTDLAKQLDVSPNEVLALAVEEFIQRHQFQQKIERLKNLSDAELEALYAEAAEEDLMLAELGLESYVTLLKEEEDSV